VLDTTIVNVTLPSIQSDLGFSPTGLAWVVNTYLIAFGGLLLFAGRLGDLAGRRNLFLAGLAVFTLAFLDRGRPGRGGRDRAAVQRLNPALAQAPLRLWCS
jgi:MFS family permease